MNHLPNGAQDYESNPHYQTLFRLLRDEAEGIIQGCEDRERVRKNTEDTSMSEEEYREFLQSLYFALPEERLSLIERYIQCISVGSALKQYYKAKTEALDAMDKMRREI